MNEISHGRNMLLLYCNWGLHENRLILSSPQIEWGHTKEPFALEEYQRTIRTGHVRATKYGFKINPTKMNVGREPLQKPRSLTQ